MAWRGDGSMTYLLYGLLAAFTRAYGFTDDLQFWNPGSEPRLHKSVPMQGDRLGCGHRGNTAFIAVPVHPLEGKRTAAFIAVFLSRLMWG